MKKKYLEWLMALKKEYSIVRKGSALCMMMLFAFTTVFAGGPQQGKLNLNAGSITYKQFFSEVHKQTGYVVMYNNADLNKNESLEVDFNNVDLKEALESVLEEKGLTFQVKDDFIILEKDKSPKPVVEQEKKSIKGKVTDDQGVPLPGVSVVVKGTNVGVATNIDGEYSLEFEGDKAVLIYSFVGMTPQEIAYTGQALQNVTLSMDTEQVGEVVVTGYQTIEKGRATGSFEVINEEKFDQTFALDYREKLEGLVPGLTVDTDGKINIRGIATFGEKTQPLYVIDGVPLPAGGEKNINTNDIKNISVLKDAASAAIWGIRASNGVIVITTKSGKAGKIKVSVRSDVQIHEKVDLHERKMMGSADYVDMEWDYYKNFGGFPTYDVNRRHRPYTDVGEVYLDAGADEEERLNALKAYDNRKDLEKWFYQNKFTQKHNVSFSGGTDKLSYYTSLAFDSGKGSLKRDKDHRYSLLSNLKYKLNDNTKVTFGIRANLRKDESNGKSPSRILPYTRLLEENGDYRDHLAGKVNKKKKRELEKLGLLNWRENLLEDMRNGDRENEANNVALNLGFETRFLDHFTYSLKASYELENSESRDFRSEKMSTTRDKINLFTDVRNPDNLIRHIPRGAILETSHGKLKTYTIRNVINFNKSWNDLNVRALFGNEIHSTTFTSERNQVFGYNKQTLNHTPVNETGLDSGVVGALGRTEVSLAQGEFKDDIDRFASFFGTANVGWKEKYELFTSWRLDKANVYSKSTNFKNNPSWSVGAKWALNKDLLEDSRTIQDLSIKASYGLSGNIDKRTSPDMIAENYIDPDTGESVLSPMNPENKALGWEKTETFNIGVDYSIFDRRISGTVEFYNKNTKDVLSNERLSLTSGWESSLRNSAKILNRGIEVSINGLVIDKKDLQWNVGFNYSHATNKIKFIDFENPTVRNYLTNEKIKGFAIDRIHVVRSAGIDENGDPLIYKGGEAVSWQEINNLELSDLKNAGRTRAPHFGSLTNDISYKDFTLSALVTYKFGHKFLLPITRKYNIGRMNIAKWNNDYWRKKGDEDHVLLPTFSRGRYNHERHLSTERSDKLIQDAGIVRLKTVKLSYSLDRVLKPMSLNGKLSFAVNNVAKWVANDYNLDSDYVGSSYAGTPTRSYVMSLNLNF